MHTENTDVTRYLSNPWPGYKILLPITEESDIYTLMNDEESALFEELRDYVRDYVMEKAKLEIGSVPQGVFRCPEDIDKSLYERCDELVHTCIDGKMNYIVKTKDDHRSYTPITLPKKVYELGRYCEVSAIETGATILLRLEEFLQRGVWQVGFLCGDTIITEISSFPHHPNGENSQSLWVNESGETCKPIIWFGLPGEEIEKEWALMINSPFDWKSFWFNDFWHLDWNALFGGYDNYYTVWMFCECGMEEPTEEFDRVRESCPILLDEHDNDEVLNDKITNFFNSNFIEGTWTFKANCLTRSEFDIKKEALRESLIDAGYAIGKMYYECNEDNENAKKLPDGRLDPDWINDGGFGDQLMESMNCLEDYMELDKTLFPGNYDRDVDQGTMRIWDNLLDLYFDYDEVEECLCLGWERLLKEIYGEDYQTY